MKTLKVIRWIALNSALAFLAYKAVIDNSEGFARVYQFWMWFGTTVFFITAFSDELRLKNKKNHLFQSLSTTLWTSHFACSLFTTAGG